MKILITGGEGYIGKYLVEKLRQKHQVTTWDIKNGEDIFDSLFEVLLQHVDIVVHLAALTSVRESFNFSDNYNLTNVEGTKRVVELCKMYKKKLIYISSAAVKDPESSPYARSKWQAENIVKLYQEEGQPFVILRLFNVYSLVAKYNTMMNVFLEHTRIYINGDGNQTRDFIQVKDVCNIIEDSFRKEYEGKLIEVGMGKGWKIYDIAKLFKKYGGKTISYKASTKEVRFSVADTMELNKLYKGSYCTDLEKDIKDMCIKGDKE